MISEPPKPAPSLKRPHLAPTALSQYVSLDNCDRYLRFYLYKGETDQLVKRLSRQAELAGTSWVPVQPLSPLLAEVGERTEQGVVEGLQAQGYDVQDLGALGVEGALEILRRCDEQPRYLYQVPMRGTLGRWPFEGRADLIRVQRDPVSGALDALIIDVKASRKDKVQHRLQVAVYVRMLEQMLAEIGVKVGHFEGSIIRRQPDGQLQDPAQALTFELEPYLTTVRFLTEGEASPLERVDAAPDFTRLHYYLGPKCDGCVFNPVCLTESAERQDLSLIPFLDSTDKRVLNQAGIFTLSDLAGLKQLVSPEVSAPEPEPQKEDIPAYETAPLSKLTQPENTGKKKWRLKTTPGKEELVEELSQRWPLAPRLDRLIQRAMRARRHFDKVTPARRYFLDRTPRLMRSNLPDDTLYPDLIKIFLDAQVDYLEDRIYLIGGLVTGKAGREKAVVRMCPDIPTAESEQALLLDWVAGIFEAIREVVGETDAAPLHLYLYNRRDQKVLLDALRRHIDCFAALPALYRLLTDTPALTQPALAFLYDEVRERLNLLGPLASLQVVSRQLGFNWTDAAGNNFLKIFRTGVFDYGLRRNDGVYVQTAARFYSGLPLEYAYAAWNKIEKATRSYKGLTQAQIEAFQAHRLRALAHIESSFPYKNSYLQKEPVQLAGLLQGSGSGSGLAQVLEEFLHIEQYSNLQQHLELFARPILKRVEQGRALLVRCTEISATQLSRRRKQLHATFLAEFDKVGIHPQTALQISKLKEGDFVTIGLLENDGQPWKIVGGRLARIEEITGEWIRVELSGSTLGQGQSSPFRYFHDRDLMPKPGEYYTIDEMVDNLNGDKLQEACRHAANNRLYQLALSGPPSDTATSPIPAEAQYFAELVQSVEGSQRAPTPDQLEVISNHLNEPLFLVQGPPGTGKSHTIGWAVLARMFLADPDKPFRVIVSSQTHNAVEIVLESIAEKWRQLTALGDERLKRLQNLRLYKAGGDEKAERLPEINFIDPWDKDQVKKALDTEDDALLVIGATPGNLYNLMKEFYGRGKKKQVVVWEEKFFDLLVLDEASQMNVPHALLAAGWLKPEGQTMIVGDHRQLAPILVHGWEHEEHLPTVSARPYRSVFQYFLDAGFPRVALSESFRLHRAQAAFLHENIYRHDQIQFHSRQQKRLPPLESVSLESRVQSPGSKILSPQSSVFSTPYVLAALHPDYPIVVIEHSEAASQQYNQVEVDLLSPLITAATTKLGLDGQDGIGIVVPHRAQKAVLQERFPALAKVNAIDTVERFQGGERDLIIVSTTASDPDYIAAEAEFLLSPNRFNVALSRPRCKLIVVTSRSIFHFVSARLELFEQSFLWKRLAAVCGEELLWSGAPVKPAEVQVRVYGHRA